MDAYEILVIILSVFLAIFLALAISVMVLTIKLLHKLHDVTNKAMHAVENVEEMAETIKNVAGTSIIGGVGAKIWKKFYHSQTKKHK